MVIVSLRSKRFRGKFRCFSGEKSWGESKKIKRGEGEREKETSLLSRTPSFFFFFALALTFCYAGMVLV